MSNKSYSRVEIIGKDGRELVYYGLVTVDVQDNGKTLKIFKVTE